MILHNILGITICKFLEIFLQKTVKNHYLHKKLRKCERNINVQKSIKSFKTRLAFSKSVALCTYGYVNAEFKNLVNYWILFYSIVFARWTRLGVVIWHSRAEHVHFTKHTCSAHKCQTIIIFGLRILLFWLFTHIQMMINDVQFTLIS